MCLAWLNRGDDRGFVGAISDPWSVTVEGRGCVAGAPRCAARSLLTEACEASNGARAGMLRLCPEADRRDDGLPAPERSEEESRAPAAREIE